MLNPETIQFSARTLAVALGLLCLLTACADGSWVIDSTTCTKSAHNFRNGPDILLNVPCLTSAGNATATTYAMVCSDITTTVEGVLFQPGAYLVNGKSSIKPFQTSERIDNAGPFESIYQSECASFSMALKIPGKCTRAHPLCMCTSGTSNSAATCRIHPVPRCSQPPLCEDEHAVRPIGPVGSAPSNRCDDWLEACTTEPTSKHLA
jgi:hypothetical protein